MGGLYNEPRLGAPRQIGDGEVAIGDPQDARTRPHWSLRTRAKATGHAPSTIHRIWRAFSLQPHRSETFKLSSDPHFVEKVRDIVGIYLAARSARLCCASMKRARSRRLIVSSIFGNDRQCVLHNFDRPKTSCSLLSSRNGNHAAGFVGDECDDPVERGGASSSCTRRSNGKPRTRKFRRSVASSPSKFDPSGVARMPQPNQKER